jgi:Ca-activated chloride channel homolog
MIAIRALVLLVLAAPLFAQTTIEWMTLESAAQERAVAEDKVILVLHADPSCSGCTSLMQKANANPLAQRLLSQFVLLRTPAVSLSKSANVIRPGMRSPTTRERVPAIGLADATGKELMTWPARLGKGTAIIDVGTLVDILQRASAAAPHIMAATRHRAAGREVEADLALGFAFRQAKEMVLASGAYSDAIAAARAKGDLETAQSAAILRELAEAARGDRRGDIERSIAELRKITREPVSQKAEAEGWLALGQLLRATDKPREAEEALERSARLSSASQDVRSATSTLLATSEKQLIGGNTNVRLLLPERAAYSGAIRAQALTRSPAIASVAFLLDGKPVANDTAPPFEAKVDVGAVPRRHELRIVARNARGQVVGEDGLVLNDRHSEFSVRLALGQNRTASASVDLPAGGALQSVAFFLDDRRIANLTAPPFVAKVSETNEGSVLRVSVTLADGRAAEDALLVGFGSELIEVQDVEFFATVLDERDQSIPNLKRSQFSVRENGAVRPILGFEYAEGAPFTVGLTLDSSTSMRSRIAEVHESARSFLTRIAEHRNSAFIVDFDTQPRLAATTTSDAAVLLTAIDGIRPDGATALHDALVFSLLQLQGVAGKRALIVLTDGRDEGSRYGVEDVARVARETGAPLYLLTLSLSIPARLKEIAVETGGRSWELRDTKSLGEVYATIERELQRQYRFNFRTTAGSSDTWRSVEVRVNQPNAKVRTASGFVPR